MSKGIYKRKKESNECYLLNRIDWGSCAAGDLCWHWIGALFKNKYAQGYRGNECKMSRLSYKIFIGRIPENMYVCHKCDNPGCINPDHLFVGTHNDNMKDMMRKNRKPKKGNAYNAKLTEKQVNEIKTNYIKGSRKFGSIAMSKKHNIHDSTIRYIISGKIWE